MDGSEIVKHIPEIASAAKVVAASVPFTAIVKRMLGPAADEVAEMWRDQVRMYRYERQLKCVEKAEKMAQEAGFTPQAVPPKILFPLLEGASMENDESLHDMWSCLLANAACSENAERVRPGFMAILRQMAPDEAQLLNWVYDFVSIKPNISHVPIEFDRFVQAYRDLGYRTPKQWTAASTYCPEDRPDRALFTAFHALLSLGLIHHRLDTDPRSVFTTYSITARGYEFVSVCRPPKPKS